MQTFRLLCSKAATLTVAVLILGACDGQSPVLVQEIDGSASTVTATVGRELDITLGTVGSGAYDSLPTISSTAVRFLDASTVAPFVPAGPRQRFRFMPQQPGTSVITFNHSGTNPTVTITVAVQ